MKNLLTYEQFINESQVNEGSVKQFETAIKNLISNVRSGYGWIDPEYVYDTVSTDSEFDEFNWKDIKDEVYQRLIDQNLLYYSNDADPETKGQKVSKVTQIEESINEAAYVPSNVLRFAKEQGSYATALVKKAATWAEKSGKSITNGTAIGKNYSTIILDMSHHGSEIYINLDKETISLFGEEVTDAKSFKKVLDANKMNESKDDFVNATLISDFEDLRKGTFVKINALEYTKGGYNESIKSIRPDGNMMKIKKSVLSVKI